MYNLKLIYSGKRLEVYRINNYVVGDKGKSVLGDVFKGDKVKDELPEEAKQHISEHKRMDTLNVARNHIIRLIKCNEDMNTFITLTFKNESNYKDSTAIFIVFFTKLRRDFKGLKYLWVLEFGSLKGRLHFHVLTNIPISIKLSNSKEKKSQEHKDLENSFREKYWVHGWIDIRHLGQEDNTNIALYVAAYITKDLINKKFDGYRIYGYSIKTLKKPIEEKVYTIDSIESVMEKLLIEYDIKFNNSYDIGYKAATGDYTGTVSYFDMIKKEEKS